jgi:hypothetical protein
MKRAILCLVILFGVFTQSIAQRDEFKEEDSDYFNKDRLHPYTNFEAGLGYLPSDEYNALRFTLAANNILLYKRIGFYATFDKGLDSDYFANLIGGSVSIINRLNVYGGFDFFTKKHGMIEQGFECRKEIGLAFYPYSLIAIRIGYSSNVKWHFGIGIKWPGPEPAPTKEEAKRKIADLNKYDR